MLALLFSVLQKKGKQKNQLILAALITLILGALTLDVLLILTNSGYIEDQNPNALEIAKRLVTFATVVGTHYYVIENINNYVKVKKFIYFLPIINLILLIAFPHFFGKNEFIYQLTHSAEINGDLFGWTFLFVELSGLVTDFIITLFYLKKVTFKNSAMLICYELLPAAVAVADYIYNTGFVFTVIALLLLVDSILSGAKQDVLIAEQKEYMAEQQKKLAVEQTKITISQIQPHFLYNVISSIMVCCKTDSEKAVTALADFSDYLRQNMRSLQCDDTIPFTKELEHIETYLRLEKLRFENRLDIEYDIAEKNFRLPALSIQPLVENAVKHGIGQRPEGGKITIRTHRVKNGVTILVADNGVGFFVPEKGLNFEGDHIGLKNVASRIENMSQGRMVIESFINKGTTVTVFIPDEKEN